ncbi:hypothetical protein [Amycolatopsis vancoresmycina]|uniref:Uncharacterized protein n=1 Tax=Amycolatopsis vancoresmycina DSM 44592 TaxID=1292037 RepID=R1FXV9_9PSEU|nr:hypothetical protein [Amycolatopsis vancoresmycina]EOD64198.1 hypothetical protein H480_33023 [Amycolatopsis vancoresmycina DSM 44592]
MRLVRLERQQSRVADDVRAALASLGRGSTVIGGIALIGVGSVTERPIEAVVLLPHGVIIVIGVDLPDPALRLEAPLGAPWKADGWPLVTDDEAVNPATEALDLSQACERRIASLVPGTAPVGTIIAVGPYVETVDQPAGDLAGPVRVLHPTPTTMLAATVSLATAHRPRSVDQVRALIKGLAPSAPEFSDEVLLGEGFSRLTDDSPPESLWDDEPSEPAGAPVAGGAVGAASGGLSDWRTETPAAAEPVVAEDPAPAAEAEPERTEVLPPEAERTGVVTPAAEDQPDSVADSALPVFPGIGTLPQSTPPGDPEPAEPASAPETPCLTAAAEPSATESGPPSEATPLKAPTAAPRPPLPSAGSPKPSPYPRPRPEPAPAAASSRTVRWVPLGAIAVLVLLAVAAIVVATTGNGTAASPAPSHTPAPPPSTARSAAPKPSLQFALRAAGGDQGCASHAFGDAQASLQQTSCSGVQRASYAATIDGRGGAVTVGIVAFPDAAQAAAFKAVADTPGGGGILDLASETGQWGATPAPRFENAAYASKLDGSSVRVVQAVWAPGPSTADDPGLVRAAKAALDLPAQ